MFKGVRSSAVSWDSGLPGGATWGGAGVFWARNGKDLPQARAAGREGIRRPFRDTIFCLGDYIRWRRARSVTEHSDLLSFSGKGMAQAGAWLGGRQEAHH